MNEGFEVSYDLDNDILYVTREGEEEKFVEIAPGINVEMGEGGEILGFEIFKASKVFKNVVGLLSDKIARAS
jgi:uncharacterized protein YuzE